MNVTEIILLLWCFGIYAGFRLLNRNVAGTVSHSSGARLRRIKNASLIIQWLVVLGFLLGIYWLLAFWFSWPFLTYGKIRIVISHSHIYTSRAGMPSEILTLWLVQTMLALTSMAVLFVLFRLYVRGILFSAKNVLCIRFLGYCLIFDWILNYLMQGMLRDMDLSTTSVGVGLLVIFLAWVMDEARKIREEQELTV